jgi:RND superfamily putative drug exporter
MTEPSRTTPPNHRPSRLSRIAGWAHRRRWRAVALWVAVLIAVTAASSAIGSDYHNDFSLPGTESQQAVDALSEQGSARAGDTVEIVMQDGDGLRDATARRQVESLVADVRELPRVAGVRSPYEDASAVSRDGTIAYATVLLDGRAQDVPAADVRRIVDTAQAAAGDGLRVELGGDAVRAAEEGEGGGAEGAGMLAALVILVLLFGSLVAAALPIVTALLAVGTSIGLIALASHLANVADFTPPIMMLVGLGVGIDYALLIFARYRGELLDGADRERAARIAMDAAGRTVVFAGCTVIIALLGLVALGLGSLQGVALAVALTVLVTMLASLTLLPALLALFGPRIERNVRRRADRGRHADGARWRAWAELVGRRPWPALAVAVAALVVLCAPALDMRLGFADAGTDPASSTSRQAYDLLAEGFGPGFSGPLLVVAEGDAEAAQTLHRTLAGTPGVAAATSPATAGEGDLSTVMAFPETAPQDAPTADLVTRLREDVLPPVERATGARFLVGGSTAATEDFASKVAARMPAFVAIVVGLSSLLLLAVFRSLLIPLKAAVLNLLSIGAALGIITLVFQEGAFGATTGPVEAFVPVMIFAIVFGLSMDYEVFLLSRMHEAWESHHDAPRAVRDGLASTGRVITAAAAIMIVVFGAFLFSPSRMLQQFGLGLAAAILLDALVIRCLVVPAVMHLLGRHAWWLPHPIARRLPRLALERT